MGDLEVELFCQQTPLTCRNFIQLCLENYYTSCVFFRVVESFMMQGGDPSNSGSGGSSVYGEAFKDEFHQKLKFNSRGMLGMANTGKDTNTSQFFITFDRCNYLDHKHTLFGRVVGNTVYNMLEMEKTQVDAQDRPKHPISILGAKVITNPFQDILVRPTLLSDKKEEKKKTGNVKNTKNRNLLSFQEDDIVTMPRGEKVQSSHDVLNDRRLKKTATRETGDTQSKKVKLANPSDHKTDRMQVDSAETSNLKKGMKKRLNNRTGRQELYWTDREQPGYSSTSSEDNATTEDKKTRKRQKEEYDNLKIELLQFKKDQKGSNNAQ